MNFTKRGDHSVHGGGMQKVASVSTTQIHRSERHKSERQIGFQCATDGVIKRTSRKKGFGTRKLGFPLGGKKEGETIVLYSKVLGFSNVVF